MYLFKIKQREIPFLCFREFILRTSSHWLFHMYCLFFKVKQHSWYRAVISFLLYLGLPTIYIVCSKAKSILTYKRPMFVYPRLHQCNLLRDKSANPSAICGECKQEHKPLTYKLLLWVHMSARSQNTAILDQMQI